jgi:NADP-dependent 3-hydroxy acid dehydrogenase YdfG
MSTRSILITGCSTGIGRCLAEGLHARGYRVFATARKADDVEELNSIGIESLRLDLDDSHSIQQAVKTRGANQARSKT